MARHDQNCTLYENGHCDCGLDALREAFNQRKDLLAALQSLVNNLPDCAIDWARDSIGNSNASAILAARDKARTAIARATGEER